VGIFVPVRPGYGWIDRLWHQFKLKVKGFGLILMMVDFDEAALSNQQ